MKQQELARLFYLEIQKIAQAEDKSDTERATALYQLMNLLFGEVTKEEKLQFTTLFARIAYVSHKFQFSGKHIFFLHRFRTQFRNLLHSASPAKVSADEISQLYALGLKVVAESVRVLYDAAIPDNINTLLENDDKFVFQPVEIQTFKSIARVIALGDDATNAQLIIRDEAYPSKELRMQYNIADRNENFNASIDQLRSTFGFPVTLNLIDVEVDKSGIYRPRAFVIEPDYLVDVTAVAECFKNFGAAPLLYLLKKYLPFETTKHLMIGNIANYFLDELMRNTDITFKETFPKVFALNPLAFAVFENSIVREIMQSSQKHFLNLKRIILEDLEKSDISLSDCFLEPSFYAERYGLQGRLDVFYHNKTEGRQSAIIELKSGKPFQPNAYGISQNHFTQTLLYDLIVKSAFKEKIAPANFILYSGIEMQHLKFAPVVKAQQMEAIQVRNQLVAIERNLCNLLQNGLDQPNIFDLINPRAISSAKGFILRDLALFEKVYKSMRSIDRKYFIAFSSFFAREHQLAKTGVQGIENLNGLAALWLNDFKEKQENFEIINHLKIKENHSKSENPILVFEKTAQTNELANFRCGDIAVLYPYINTGDTALDNQIFKCTIIDINTEQITLRLRCHQFNDSLFVDDIFWNIEHDLLDSGFTNMYRNLFQFVQYPDEKKDLLLGIRPPRQVETPLEIKPPAELTLEQKDIFIKILSSQDYHLLWGPPGTGKTSMMLKHLVKYLLNESDEQLLLLAYTNRAVDEICEAIESIDKYAKDEYLRIGSRYSTDPRFRDKLLDSQLAKVQSRQELKAIIDKHRIVVSTVASIASKQELLQLKKFDRVIIDEASQILEPMLIGLLPQFEHFVLIGDHQQLPAVVVQREADAAIHDPDLKAIGMSNMGDSLFERLYKRAVRQSWDWAYSQLSHQGRMHRDIMQFPNKFFYEGALEILPKHMPQHQLQLQALNYTLPDNPTELEQLISSQRVLFIPCQIDESGNKTNIFEANMVAELIHGFQRIYAASNKEFLAGSLGLITPYRAQIAQISDTLRSRQIDKRDLTIDTVERYQGGARDIIIISLCTNHINQLSRLISLSSDGIDRKLNVALTRARQHLIILGNEEVLQHNGIYRDLMAHARANISPAFKEC